FGIVGKDQTIELRVLDTANQPEPVVLKVRRDGNPVATLKVWESHDLLEAIHPQLQKRKPDYDSLNKRLGALMKANHVPDDVVKMVTGMAAKFAGGMSKEQQAAWSQAQTYLALGNALNGAKSLGFDSCPMGGFDPKEYSRILRIPSHLTPVMLCPIGYAADTPGQKIRFAKSEIVF
ncbi:MAG: nitroreductase family protein, partial [Methanoregula sp.]